MANKAAVFIILQSMCTHTLKQNKFFFCVVFLMFVFYFITRYFVLPFIRSRLIKETLVWYINADLKSEERNLIKTRFKKRIFVSHLRRRTEKITPYNVLHCTMLKAPRRWIHIQNKLYNSNNFYFSSNWQRNSTFLGSVFPNNIRANITFVDQKRSFFSSD